MNLLDRIRIAIVKSRASEGDPWGIFNPIDACLEAASEYAVQYDAVHGKGCYTSSPDGRELGVVGYLRGKLHGAVVDILDKSITDGDDEIRMTAAAEIFVMTTREALHASVMALDTIDSKPYFVSMVRVGVEGEEKHEALQQLAWQFTQFAQDHGLTDEADLLLDTMRGRLSLGAVHGPSVKPVT